MKAEELRKMELKGLGELADVKRSEVLNLGMEFSKGKGEGNVRKVRAAKKDLARILTIISEKEQNAKKA